MLEFQNEPSLGGEEEKRLVAKALTRDAQWLGTALLLVLAFSSIWGTVFPAVLDFFWPTAKETWNIYYQAVLYVLTSPLSIVPAFCIAVKAADRTIGEFTLFGGVPFGELAGCVLLGFWGILLGNGLSDCAEVLFPYADQNLTEMMGATAQTPIELLAELVYVCLVPAIVEEFAFRGVTLFMLRKYGDWFAVIVSALLFGVFHGNVIQLPFAACLGVVAGYITLRTNRLIPAILLHFFNNGISCLVAYFGDSLYGLLGPYVYLALYGIWLILGAVGLLVLRLWGKRPLREGCRRYDGCLSVGGRILSLAKAFVLVAAVLVNLATAIILILPVMNYDGLLS